MGAGQVEPLTLLPPVVPGALILRLQKYRQPAQAPVPIREAADEVAAEATRLLAPRAVLWRGRVTVDAATGRVVIGTQPVQSRGLARVLAASREAYVLVLTIGPGVEERARAMFEERLLLESFLMDTAGWAAIELLVRGVRRRLIERERPVGRTVTHRLGPGHLDWSVEEQGALLGVFGDTPLPVRLTDAALMIPHKSISAVFGVAGAR
jgi:hypothetical protein